MLTSLIGLMTTLTSLMGLSAENYRRSESKTLGKRSGEDKVELCVKCMRWVMEAAKFAFKLKLHCSGGGIYMQPIWKPSSSGDTLNNLDGELVLLNTLLSLVFLNLQRWWEKVVWDSVCGEEDGNQLSHAVTSQDPTPSLLLYLCICVFVYLCIRVFVYLCICVERMAINCQKPLHHKTRPLLCCYFLTAPMLLTVTAVVSVSVATKQSNHP